MLLGPPYHALHVGGLHVHALRRLGDPPVAGGAVQLSHPGGLGADGLALGKGVVVAATVDEAKTAAREMMEDKKFGTMPSTSVAFTSTHRAIWAMPPLPGAQNSPVTLGDCFNFLQVRGEVYRPARRLHPGRPRHRHRRQARYGDGVYRDSAVPPLRGALDVDVDGVVPVGAADAVHKGEGQHLGMLPQPPGIRYTDEALEILRSKRKGGYNVVKIDPSYTPQAQGGPGGGDVLEGGGGGQSGGLFQGLHQLPGVHSDGVIAPDYTPEALEILREKRKGGYNVVKINPDYTPSPEGSP